MNEEERVKLNKLWEDAKEKKQNRTKAERMRFYWKVKEMVHKEREEWGSKNTSGGGKTKLKAAYANVNGIIRALLELNYFISKNKLDIIIITEVP